jgi:asparagine synthase (glutamine-hydrolysing)
MCGIAGIISEKEAVVRRALSAMVAAQSHRGPDDAGEEVLPFGNRWIGLGHRRLSIIDLSAAGHQPMRHPGTGDRIVFNGEIYNFQRLRKDLDAAGGNEQFAGHSDTEVLLHGLSRWGTDYLTQLQGMYAFGFLNVGQNVLTLARDPLGIKPLYVAEHEGTVLFASEVRGILASGLIPREIDMQAVAGYLAYGAVQQPLTIIRGIRSLPPGSYQQFRAAPAAHDNGAAPVTAPPTRFWSFPAPRLGVSREHAVVEVDRLLDDAVHDHLISDVPVGVFLSSGLDSTAVASLAAKHSSDLRSFTVGFADQPDMSELTLAGETAQHLGLRHTEIILNGEDAEATVWDWLESLDQPSTDGLNVYVISKAVRAHGITVALSGQGGDELFGGYPSFRDVPRLRPWVGMLSKVPRPLRRAMCTLAAANRSAAVRDKLGDIADTDGSVLQLYLQRRRAMSNRQLAALGVSPQRLGLRDDYLPQAALHDIATPDGADADAVWQVSQLESRLYQGNMLLRDGDANGMCHGLEIRVPMLDQRVVNYVTALPGSVRLPNGVADKHLLRVACARFMRPALLRQGKRGFALPINRWMLGPMRDLCESALAALKVSGCLEPAGVDRVWEAYLREPESPMWTRAWALCVLGCHLKKLGSYTAPAGRDVAHDGSALASSRS